MLNKQKWYCYFFICDKDFNFTFVFFCFNNIHSTIYYNLPMKYNKMEFIKSERGKKVGMELRKIWKGKFVPTPWILYKLIYTIYCHICIHFDKKKNSSLSAVLQISVINGENHTLTHLTWVSQKFCNILVCNQSSSSHGR